MNIPWIESPLFEKTLNEKKLSEEERELARDYHTNGYAIIRNCLEEDLITRVLEDISNDFPPKLNEEPRRQAELWKKYASVQNLAKVEKIKTILNFLYERKPIPFQTLNFKFGSQQRLHTDMIHFSSIPKRFMCGVWIALEDTDENNGPLLYCPGSHKLDDYFYSDIGIETDYPGDGDGFNKGGGYNNYGLYEDFIQTLVEVKKFEVKELHVKKGDILIWSSNLIHGGKEVLQPNRTRWSQVTHYYFENCTYYTPMWSNMLTHELFLRNVTDIFMDVPVPNKLNGREINTLYTGKSRHSLIETFNPSLLKTLTWKQIFILLKDRIKQSFNRS